MFAQIETMRMAQALGRHAANRHRVTAMNIANADTPGYRRKTIDFQPGTEGGVRPGPMRLDPAPFTKVFDPGHPLADALGQYDGSNVEMITEIADAREAQRSYDANLKIFDQSRQMTQSLFELLRR